MTACVVSGVGNSSPAAGYHLLTSCSGRTPSQTRRLRRSAVEMEAPHSLSRRSADGCCGGDGVSDSDLVGLAPRLDFLRCPLGGLIAVAGYAPTQRRTP
jgi:hypothetical protein